MLAPTMIARTNVGVAAAIVVTFLVGRIGREGAGTGKGRALVDVVILLRVMPPYRVILQRWIGQPLKAPAAAVAAPIAIGLRAWADISLSAGRARTAERATRHRGGGAGNHDGDCRYQS